MRHKKIGNYNCIFKWRGEGKRHCRFDLLVGGIFKIVYETEEMWLPGLPIWVSTWKQMISIIHKWAFQNFKLSTLSSHWRGPWRWTSIQQGVEVTSCLWYSAPQPFTKLILGGKVLKKQADGTPNMRNFKEWQENEGVTRYVKIKQNLIVHILVSSYTASNPWFTDWEKWTTWRPVKIRQLTIPGWEVWRTPDCWKSWDCNQAGSCTPKTHTGCFFYWSALNNDEVSHYM